MTSRSTILVVIVGCGRLGSVLANRLSGKEHHVIVVDRSEGALENLSAELSGARVLGNGTELSVLKRPQVDRAYAVFAVTGEDAVNLMVAQAARKIFGAPNVVARMSDPAKEPIYHSLGIETVWPTTLAAEKYLQRLFKSTDRLA